MTEPTPQEIAARVRGMAQELADARAALHLKPGQPLGDRIRNLTEELDGRATSIEALRGDLDGVRAALSLAERKITDRAQERSAMWDVLAGERAKTLEARREFAELRDAARTMLPEGSTPNPATGWLADVIRGAAARADSLTRARDLAHENANRARTGEGAAVLRAEAAEAKVARLLAPPAVINLPPALRGALDAVQDEITGVEATPEGLADGVHKLIVKLKAARRGWGKESGNAARARVQLRSFLAHGLGVGALGQLDGQPLVAQAGAARQLADEIHAWDAWADAQLGTYPVGNRHRRDALAERLAKAIADRDTSRQAAELAGEAAEQWAAEVERLRVKHKALRDAVRDLA